MESARAAEFFCGPAQTTTTISDKTLSKAFGADDDEGGEKARFVIEAFTYNLERQSYVRAARLLSLPYAPRRRNRPRQPVKMEPRSRRRRQIPRSRFFGKSEEDVSNAKMMSGRSARGPRASGGDGITASVRRCSLMLAR
jgi:hypothetical protein